MDDSESMDQRTGPGGTGKAAEPLLQADQDQPQRGDTGGAGGTSTLTGSQIRAAHETQRVLQMTWTEFRHYMAARYPDYLAHWDKSA